MSSYVVERQTHFVHWDMREKFLKISPMTIDTNHKQAGFHPYKSSKGQLLTNKQKRAKLEFWQWLVNSKCCSISNKIAAISSTWCNFPNYVIKWDIITHQLWYQSLNYVSQLLSSIVSTFFKVHWYTLYLTTLS